MEDLSGKAPGNQWTAAESNQAQAEIQKVITNSGISLSGADLNQMAKSLSTQIPDVAWLNMSGSATVMVLTKLTPHQSLRAYTDGALFRFRTTAANTGAFTVNIDTLGAKDVVRQDGSTPEANDVIITADTLIRYDLANDEFKLSSRTGQEFQKGYIEGGQMTRSGTGLITITPCLFRNAPDDQDGTIGAFAKDYTPATGWATGTGNAGLPSTVSHVTNTGISVFVMVDDTGATEMGFDTSSTGVNLIAEAGTVTSTTWTVRRIGLLMSHETTATTLHGFNQDLSNLNHIHYDHPIKSVSLVQFSTSSISKVIYAPVGTVADIVFEVEYTPVLAANVFCVLRSFNEDNTTPGEPEHTIRFNSGDFGVAPLRMMPEVDSSKQVFVRGSVVSSDFRYSIFVYGYWFDRGNV